MNSKITLAAADWFAKLFSYTHSVLSVLKKLSATALSQRISDQVLIGIHCLFGSCFVGSKETLANVF
jgi:hypothetical protein